MSATVTKPCGNCGQPVEQQAAELEGRFAQIAASLTVLCSTCSAAQDVEDAARQEREASEERAGRVAERFKRSGLPPKHRVALDDLDHAAAVLDAARAWATGGGGLVLTGEIGRGKTTVAGSACWARLQSRAVTWTSAPLLFARLGTGLGTDQRGWALDVLAARHGLVLDDIDKARPTEYGAEQVFLAIDQRVEHEAPLLVTSNLSPAQLAEKWPEPYGPAIASRLVGYCRVVRVDGVDRRLQPTTEGVGS